MLSFPNPDWVEELKASYQDLETQKLIEIVQYNFNLPKGYQWR